MLKGRSVGLTKIQTNLPWSLSATVYKIDAVLGQCCTVLL